MRHYLAAAVFAVAMTMGTASRVDALATPPAVSPLVRADYQGEDVVFTFPEGTRQSSVSFTLNRHRLTPTWLGWHHKSVRWTSATELRVSSHLLRCFGNPHEGLWVFGEAAGYVSLLQFVVVANMPLDYHPHWHHGHHHHWRHHHGGHGHGGHHGHHGARHAHAAAAPAATEAPAAESKPAAPKAH